MRAKPHSTSMENPGAILDKLWRKGAVLGRKLLCRASRKELSAQGDGKPGIEECPNGAVPKQNPDRTLGDEVRVIWDLRINNADGHVLNHAPALTPRHKELGRGIIWWEIRLPGGIVLMVKLDVAGAFTLVWLRPSDCGKVSTEIGAEEWGLTAEDVVAAISLTLEFGGCGSPGEWVPWSWGLKGVHSHVHPARPEWHGMECSSSSYLVDDQAILEMGMGRRPWMSKRAAKRKTKNLLGEGSSNDDKENIEGKPSVMQIMWGLIVNSLLKTIGIDRKAHV